MTTYHIIETTHYPHERTKRAWVTVEEKPTGKRLTVHLQYNLFSQGWFAIAQNRVEGDAPFVNAAIAAITY